MFDSRKLLGCALLLVGAAAALATELGARPEPQPIFVPPALRARSPSLEPSGVVWSKALSRYLVVSDDIGPADGHHQPWLLTMSRDGRFDDAPLTIAGLDELNDAESICAGPDDTFFIMTSHSPNKKGLVPPSRRLLLWTRLQGRALVVAGKLDLTTARDRKGGALLEIAGLPPDGRLDIEAVTYRDGALLFGLKSPLSATGEATVLKLASAVAALKAGSIPAGAVTRLWSLPLTTPGGVPEGVADLTSLPDGSLAIVANAPKGGARDGGGALYSYRPGSAPRLVRWFPHLKPEGVTVSDDGKSLVLVFDTDDEPPLWLRLPLPLAAAGANPS